MLSACNSAETDRACCCCCCCGGGAGAGAGGAGGVERLLVVVVVVEKEKVVVVAAGVVCAASVISGKPVAACLLRAWSSINMSISNARPGINIKSWLRSAMPKER